GGAPGELAGAAAWLWGQRRLREGSAAEAAGWFGEAADHFIRSSPTSVLGERIAACYIGQVTSYLLAEQLDAAQQGFARTGARAAVPEAALLFARQVYEVAEAVRDLPRGEREEALAPVR